MRSTKNLLKFLLLSTTLLLMSTLFVCGNTDSTKATEKKSEGVYTQEQYTPFTPEQTTVKQTQSVRVNPEISLFKTEDVVYVDSILNGMTTRIVDCITKEKIEIKKSKIKEAKAYLFILPASFVLSLIGIWIGTRSENTYISWIGVILFTITVTIFLIKIPILLLL